MTILVFIAAMAGVVAWPAVVLIIFFSLRSKMPDIIERLEEIKLPGGAEFKLRQKFEEAREITQTVQIDEKPATVPVLPSPQLTEPQADYMELATKFPSSAIQQSFQALTKHLREASDKLGVPASRHIGDVLDHLRDRGVIDNHMHRLYGSLSDIRNLAVHKNHVTSGEALEFVSMCGVFEHALNTYPTKIIQRD